MNTVMVSYIFSLVFILISVMYLSEQNLTECNKAIFKNVGNLLQLCPKTEKLIFFQQLLAYFKILKIT